MEAIHTGFVKDAMRTTEPMQKGGLSGPKDVSPPTPSEMENLEKKLAHAAKALELSADLLSARVDTFLQRADGCGGAEEPHPEPGTLGALHYWTRRIDAQSARLAGSIADVAAII